MNYKYFVIFSILLFSLFQILLADSLAQSYDSPRKQAEKGVAPDKIICREGLHIIFKKHWFSACVTPPTLSKLVERGWSDSPTPIPEDLNNVTIKLERTACFGACPIYSVTIHGNGTVNYEGVRFVEVLGESTYQIPVNKIKELISLVYDVNYFSLNERYEANVTDMPSVITVITVGDKTKSVDNYGNAGPQKLQQLEEKIDEVSQPRKLIKIKPNDNIPNPTSIVEFSRLSNVFGFDMYAKIISETNENVFFSPYSLSSAFSILYEGAKGPTKDEIKSVFHFAERPKIQREYSYQIISALNEPSKDYTLNSANGLWIEKTFPVLGEYKDTVKTYYMSEIQNLDFITKSEEARDSINKWAEEKTSDRIKDLIPPGAINEMTRLVITNAIYFLGNWETQFDEKVTREDDFKISEKETVRVPMMNMEHTFSYMEEDNLQALEIPYKGNNLSMLVLLPKGNQLYSLEKNLSNENVRKWQENMIKKQVNLSIPRFQLEETYSLKQDLSEMGMPTVFDGIEADLSEINGKTDLYVSDVFHKTFVLLDEKGTEAAAATGIVVGTTSAGPVPEEFRVDHPFVFLIQDNRTGLILFIGKVVDPTK